MSRAAPHEDHPGRGSLENVSGIRQLALVARGGSHEFARRIEIPDRGFQYRLGGLGLKGCRAGFGLVPVLPPEKLGPAHPVDTEIRIAIELEHRVDVSRANFDGERLGIERELARLRKKRVFDLGSRFLVLPEGHSHAPHRFERCFASARFDRLLDGEELGVKRDRLAPRALAIGPGGPLGIEVAVKGLLQPREIGELAMPFRPVLALDRDLGLKLGRSLRALREAQPGPKRSRGLRRRLLLQARDPQPHIIPAAHLVELKSRQTLNLRLGRAEEFCRDFSWRGPFELLYLLDVLEKSNKPFLGRSHHGAPSLSRFGFVRGVFSSSARRQ